MTAIKHQTVVTIANNPLYEVSKNAWNDAHLLPGAAGEVFYADGSNGISALANGVGVLSNDGTGVLSWTVSGAVTSVSNVDGTLTISPTTGAVVASLALGHANTWTGQQTFSTLAPVFSTMTQGSVFFAGTGGLLSQDNANFFWDDANNRLGLGTTTPAQPLQIYRTAANAYANINAYYGDTTTTTGLNAAAAYSLSIDAGLAGNMCAHSVKYNNGVTNGVYQPSQFVVQSFAAATNGMLIATNSANDLVFVTDAGAGAGSERIRILGAAGSGSVAGNSGMGVANPTATLHVKAGTTAAGSAPLKLTSGALNTTAEVGAVEFLTDKFYGTITTGAARKELVLWDAAATSGRVPYVTTNGRLADDAALTYDATNDRLMLGTATTTATNDIYLKKTVDGAVRVVVENASTGTAAQANVFCYNDVSNDYIALLKMSSAFTTSGLVASAISWLTSRLNDLLISTRQSGKAIIFATGGDATTNERLRLDGSGNVSIGNAALATTATDGFLYIPTCAGTPTGAATAKTGLVPLVYDTTGNFLYVRNGGTWKKTTVFA